MFATPCINSSNPRKEVFDGQREAGCRDARLHSTYVRTHSDFALGICHQRLRSTNTGSSQVAGRTGTRRSSPRCSTGVSLIHHPHPVLVARRVADHAPDAMMRSPSACASASRLTILRCRSSHPDVSVGGDAAEGLALPHRRPHPGVTAHLRLPPEEDRAHYARQREVHLAAPQAGCRLVHRHQGRRADGIHRHRRPFEI